MQVDLLLMSDPSTWPESLMDGFEPPKGLMPPRWRQWGAVRMAQEWLEQHEIAIPRLTIEVHYREHLPQYPSQTGELVKQGALSNGDPLPTEPGPLPLIEDYRAYFRDSLRIGRRALLALERRIDQLEQAGEPVPVSLLEKLMSTGASLARSQATLIVNKGARFHKDDDEDADDVLRGFMGPRPGPRFGSTRIRVIEGETRAITDQGDKDRYEYNQRADSLGAPRLPY